MIGRQPRPGNEVPRLIASPPDRSAPRRGLRFAVWPGHHMGVKSRDYRLANALASVLIHHGSSRMEETNSQSPFENEPTANYLELRQFREKRHPEQPHRKLVVGKHDGRDVRNREFADGDF